MWKTNKRLRGIFAGLIMSVGLVGCTGHSIILPGEEKFVQSPFENYEDAYQAFESVAVNETTLAKLFDAGYDVATFPNVRSLSYLDLIAHFLPHESITFADLDPALRACFEARLTCKGYQLSPSHVEQDRTGNVMLDMFNFQRTEVMTGWKADAIFVLHDDVVVYKVWSGTRSVNETRKRTNPLGPFQNMSGAVPVAFSSVMNRPR